MELHQLRYFVAVAQTGNFSRAAERCFVSQPSLSQQIQKLERQLKQPLFHRLGRKAVLTDAGRMLLDRALSILAGVDDAERRLRQATRRRGPGWRSGRFRRSRLCSAADAGELYAPVAARRADRARGCDDANWCPRCSKGIWTWRWSPCRWWIRTWSASRCWSSRCSLAVPQGHALATRKRVTVRDLASERFILLERNALPGRAGAQLLSGPRMSAVHRLQKHQITTIQQLIALGRACRCLPDLARRGDDTGRIVYRPLTGEQPQRTVGVIWHKHYFHSPLASKYLGELRQWAKRLAK